MLDNETRRSLLNRTKQSGYPGSILDVYRAAEQGLDILAEHETQMQMQQQEMQVAQTQQQQETGLREEHAQGNTGASMAFPNVQPNQSFNTVGMKAPIDIQKIDNQGHLVESYKNVPPGIQDLPTGPYEGTIIESPAAYQTGGVKKNERLKEAVLDAADKIFINPHDLGKEEDAQRGALFTNPSLDRITQQGENWIKRITSKPKQYYDAYVKGNPYARAAIEEDKYRKTFKRKMTAPNPVGIATKTAGPFIAAMLSPLKAGEGSTLSPEQRGWQTSNITMPSGETKPVTTIGETTPFTSEEITDLNQYLSGVMAPKIKQKGGLRKRGYIQKHQTGGFNFDPITSTQDQIVNQTQQIQINQDAKQFQVQQDKDLEELNDWDFKDKYGTNKHTVRRSIDAAYAASFENRGDIGGGTVKSYYDQFKGNNPNLQWISGASNQMYASPEEKQRVQDYHQNWIGAVTPIPVLEGINLTAKGARIPGIIDDVILGPLAKGYKGIKGIVADKVKTGTVVSSKTGKTIDEFTKFQPTSKMGSEVQDVLNTRVQYVTSDEYFKLRQANTGESTKQIKTSVENYIKELNETTIRFKPEGSSMHGNLGEYTKNEIRIAFPKQSTEYLPPNWLDTFDHETLHLLSPAGKVNPNMPAKYITEGGEQIKNPAWKKYILEGGARTEGSVVTTISGNTVKQKWSGAYENYPKIEVDHSMKKIGNQKHGVDGFYSYLMDPAEQQVRMVRAKEFLKTKHGWDGTAAGLTDEILENLSKDTKVFGGHGDLPWDVKQLIDNVEGAATGGKAWKEKMRQVLPYAWGAVPVSMGLNIQSEGGLRKRSYKQKYQTGGDKEEFPNLLPEVEVSALKDKSYNKLSDSQKQVYDSFVTPGGTAQTVNIGGDREMHWKNALQMITDTDVNISNVPSKNIFGYDTQKVKKEGYSKGVFRAHADRYTKEINVPAHQVYKDQADYSIEKYKDQRGPLTEKDRVIYEQYARKKYFDNIIAESAHMPEFYRKESLWNLPISRMRDLGRLFTGVGYDKGAYSDPHHIEYKTHVGPDSFEEKLRSKYEIKQKGGLRNHMMDYLHDTGRDTTYVNTVMNAIGQHESKNNPNQVQVSGNETEGFYDGPGRGTYQFEVGEEKGGNTAINRTANFLKYNTDKNIRDFPILNTLYNSSSSLDFSKLSKKDQQGLFIGDKIFGGPERRNEFDAVTRNRTTPPSQEETFMYWLNNHKGKVNGKNISELTSEEIETERKKWNTRTKNMFQKGGLRLNTPLSLKRTPFTLATRQPIRRSGRTTNIQDIGENVESYFNAYANPTLLNTKKLNISAKSNIAPQIGWNPNNQSFSKYGSPTIGLKGSLGLNAIYNPTKRTTFTAGVDYVTGSKPRYRAGVNFRLKRGGYRKKYL